MSGWANRHSPSVERRRSGRLGQRARAPRRSGVAEQLLDEGSRRSAMPMTEATPSASRASGSSASMRAPSTARRVIGTRGRRRVDERDPAVAPAPACRPRGRPGPSRRRTAGCRRSARGCCAPRRRRPRRGRRAWRGWAVSGSASPSGRAARRRAARPSAGSVGRARAGQDDERAAARAPRRGARPSPTLEGSSQCRSSMTTTRGPVVVSRRSR